MLPSRRALLRATGASLVGSLAGCALGGPSRGDLTVTPAPVPTETVTPSPTPAPPTPRRPTTADVSFDVTVVDDFAPEHPARLEVAFGNAAGAALVGTGDQPFVVPFADEDYAGEWPDGSLALFVLPDESPLRLEPADAGRGPVEAFLPDAPTDGCWRLPFDWPGARGSSFLVHYVYRLAPGETLRHGYTLYWIDDCAAGTVAFERRFDLRFVGDEGRPGPTAAVEVGFDLTVADDGTLSVEVHGPRVETPAPDW